MLKLFRKLKENIIDWAYSSDEKFVEEIYFNDNIQVLTPTGYQNFTGIGKTAKFKEYKVKTETGKEVICADKHIFLDETGLNRWTIDLIPNQSYIQTKDGIEKVIDISLTGNSSNMYDLLNVKDSLYYTNDIVSHNSTIFAVFLLHFILFNRNKTVAILGNKQKQSMEILSRIKQAYVNLPKWLQQGIVTWNMTEIQLENGSKIIAAATSSDAIRGMSVSLLVVDECITGDSLITLRNKETGEITLDTIENVYDSL